MYRWPTSFPLPTQALTLDGQATSVRTQMESGYVRQRRRFSREFIQVQVTWELSSLEMEIFTSFHKFKLNLGSDWFLLPLVSGDTVVDHTVRFVSGVFQQTYVPVGYWTVTARLDIDERVAFTEPVLDAYMFIGTSDINLTNFLNSVSLLHNAVHVVLPNKLN